MIVYKVTNLINNKFYIGITYKTAEERLNDHWREAKSRKKNNKTLTYFHNALLYYGIENFKTEVIDYAKTREELNQKEIKWIEQLDALNREKAYNRQSGGQSGIKDETTRALIGQKKKENWKDEECANKMREGLKKATQAWQQKCEEQKVELICQNCGKRFKVIPSEANKRKYCSIQCAGHINSKNALNSMIQNKKEKTEQNYLMFQQAVNKWIINNKELIINCPYNKISTNLKDLQNLSKEFGFTDWRIISKSICGKDSRKELLKYLKEKCENIC